MGTTRNAGCLSGKTVGSCIAVAPELVFDPADLRLREPSRGLASRFVAQLASENLTNVRLGQLGAKFDIARALVSGEMLAAVGDDAVGGQARILSDDEKPHGLA